jgi:hypothetical protein
MADKPHPEDAADRYSEEETDRRMDATIRAMIGMAPKPHPSPTPKAKKRKRPVDKHKSRA